MKPFERRIFLLAYKLSCQEKMAVAAILCYTNTFIALKVLIRGIIRNKMPVFGTS